MVRLHGVWRPLGSTSGSWRLIHSVRKTTHGDYQHFMNALVMIHGCMASHSPSWEFLFSVMTEVSWCVAFHSPSWEFLCSAMAGFLSPFGGYDVSLRAFLPTHTHTHTHTLVHALSKSCTNTLHWDCESSLAQLDLPDRVVTSRQHLPSQWQHLSTMRFNSDKGIEWQKDKLIWEETKR